MGALKLSDDIKVCLQNDLVNHHFYYVEDWDLNEKNNNQIETVEPTSKTDDKFIRKFLRKCYFGKLVSNLTAVGRNYYFFVNITQNGVSLRKITFLPVTKFII